MKVAINWLKELVEITTPMDELLHLINYRAIGTREVTDKFIELDMKGYNRADLLSLRGVAYEVAAITNSKVTFTETKASDYLWVKKSYPATQVQVEDEELCPLYSLAKIEGLKVGPSPKEWVEKLEASGLRSINNIADVTNLIMLEYGQPLHSFDADTISDEKIIVRTAKKGEQLVTLDNKTRVLEESDLVIADSQKAVGLAGVMGGKNSEITDKTTTILLEAAIFNPQNLRKTARRLALQSEASKRFYHGLTKTRLLQALNQAMIMYEELGGKVTALTIKGDTEDQLQKIPLRQSKTSSLIGVNFESKDIQNYLQQLNFELKEIDASSWVVTPPYYRLDVNIEEDIIEEVARMYGYEKIPSTPLPGNTPQAVKHPLFELIFNAKKTLVELGLTEVQTYSYYSTRALNALGFNDQNKDTLIKLANPISSETEYLRANVWPNLMDVVSNNLKTFDDIAVFEIGKAYTKESEDKFTENFRLSIALSNNTDQPITELYEIAKRLFNKLNLDVKYETGKDLLGLFHPVRFQDINFQGKLIGGIAEVHPRVAFKYGFTQRTAILEIDLEKLI